MLINSQKAIKIDRNMSEYWRSLCKHITLTLVHLLVLLYELFINVRTWITLRWASTTIAFTLGLVWQSIYRIDPEMEQFIEEISCLLNYLLLTYVLAYLLTPWSRVILEKLTCSQLVKKFPAFYGTRRFINAFTSALHLSLSWARSIQSMPSHPTSWRSILILFSHQRQGLPSALVPSGFPHPNPVYTSTLPHTCYLPVYLILIDFLPDNIP